LEFICGDWRGRGEWIGNEGGVKHENVDNGELRDI
jgi:hypothetical protein